MISRSPARPTARGSIVANVALDFPLAKVSPGTSLLERRSHQPDARFYSTYLVNVWAKMRSRPPKKKPAAIAKAITTAVKRVVSSRLGHTDLRNSEKVS